MNKELLKKLVIWLEPLAIIEAFELFFLLCNHISQINISKIYILMEFFVLYLVYMLLLLIFKKNYVAVSIFSIFLFIFSVINQVVIYYTQSPVFFSDILFLFSSSELASIVGGTLTTAIGTLLLPIFYYLAITIIFIIVSFSYKYTIDNNVIRYSSICAIVLFLVFLFNPTKGFRNYVLNSIFKANNRKDYDAEIENIEYIGNKGIFLGMYSNYLENIIYKPDDYNEEDIENELNNTSDISVDKSFGQPNIIVLFAESFWNIDDVEDIKFDKDILENYKKLKNEGISFEMISPSYGGISANVEFEFLTGANLMYFGKGYIPYMQLYTNSKYKTNPSLIDELNNNDYYTKIVAYTTKNLFNCGRFYNILNVDSTEFHHDIDLKDKKGIYVSDEYVVNKIIEEFDKKEKGKKEFYMTLTMQGHMPYTKKKYDKYDIKVLDNKYNDVTNEQLLAYAQGIYDMDKQLKRLYDYIKEYDEPTIIVFYGDHLPYLEYIKYGEYFNTDNELLNLYRKYNTESLILANFDIKEDNYKYLGPDLLSTYILNRMDIDISKYYKWLYKTIDILPSSNLYVSVDKDGNIYNTNNLKDDKYDIYKLRRNIQYKYFIK